MGIPEISFATTSFTQCVHNHRQEAPAGSARRSVGLLGSPSCPPARLPWPLRVHPVSSQGRTGMLLGGTWLLKRPSRRAPRPSPRFLRAAVHTGTPKPDETTTRGAVDVDAGDLDDPVQPVAQGVAVDRTCCRRRPLVEVVFDKEVERPGQLLVVIHQRAGDPTPDPIRDMRRSSSQQLGKVVHEAYGTAASAGLRDFNDRSELVEGPPRDTLPSPGRPRHSPPDRPPVAGQSRSSAPPTGPSGS